MSPEQTMERTRRLSTLLLAIGLPLIAILYLFVDIHVPPLVASLKDSSLVEAAGIYTNLGNRMPWFYAISLGLALAVAVEWKSGPTRFSRVMFFVCVAFGLSVIFGDTLKVLFGRARPPLLLEHGEYGFTWFASGSMHHSFPSGHTLRTFSAFTALSLRFKRLAPIFMTLATLEAASRVMVLRHYPGDVLCGAMVGMLAALWADAILARTWETPAAPGPDSSSRF